MALQRDLVEAEKNQFGEPRIFCAHCHKPADYTQTDNKSGGLVYELMCPTPDPHARTLGTWINEEQRAADIRKFLEGHEIRRYKESQH